MFTANQPNQSVSAQRGYSLWRLNFDNEMINYSMKRKFDSKYYWPTEFDRNEWFFWPNGNEYYYQRVKLDDDLVLSSRVSLNRSIRLVDIANRCQHWQPTHSSLSFLLLFIKSHEAKEQVKKRNTSPRIQCERHLFDTGRRQLFSQFIFSLNCVRFECN